MDLPAWYQCLHYRNEANTGISFFVLSFSVIGMLNMGWVGLVMLPVLVAFERWYYYTYKPFDLGVSGIYSLLSGFMLAGTWFGGASRLTTICGLFILTGNLYVWWQQQAQVAHWKAHFFNQIMGFMVGVAMFYVFKFRAGNW